MSNAWNFWPQLIGGTYNGDFEFAGFRNAVKKIVIFSWMEAAQARRLTASKIHASINITEDSESTLNYGNDIRTVSGLNLDIL